MYHFKHNVTNRLHKPICQKYIPSISNGYSLIAGITDCNEIINSYTLSGKYITMENGRHAEMINHAQYCDLQPNQLVIAIISLVKDIDPEPDISLLTKGLRIANIDYLQWKIGDQVLLKQHQQNILFLIDDLKLPKYLNKILTCNWI